MLIIRPRGEKVQILCVSSFCASQKLVQAILRARFYRVQELAEPVQNFEMLLFGSRLEH